jgi:hypothetical protein
VHESMAVSLRYNQCNTKRSGREYNSHDDLGTAIAVV